MDNTCILSTAYWATIQYFTKFLIFNKIQIEQWETYPRQSYRNRMVIYGANGVQTLQVPVAKGSFKKILLKDIKISYDTNWQKNHFKTIESAYRSSPFYEYYIDDIVPFYKKRYKYLLDLNHNILEVVLSVLELQYKINYTDKFELHPNFVDFRNSIHPKKEKQNFDASFKPVEYIQGFEQRHGFVSNLSIIDLIFNTGPEAVSILSKSIVKNEI